MLCLDPDRRISADQALCHPFFAELHDPLDEPICLQPFYVEHEIDNLPMKVLKGKILEDSCINHNGKKTNNTSDEHLFKDFEETFVIDDIYFKNKNLKGNSMIEDNDSGSKGHISNYLRVDHSKINSKEINEKKDFIPNLNDVISRETLLDEPWIDPGVCERKYHASNNNCHITNQRVSSLKIVSQKPSYYSGFSPVIDLSVYETCHFSEKHERAYVNSKQPSANRNLNEKIITKLCEESSLRKFDVEEMISNRKLSSMPCTTWQSVWFSI